MPVQPDKAKPRPKTALELAAEAEVDAMLERAGEGPRTIETERERIAELVVLPRPFTDDERREFKRLAKRWRNRRARARRFAAAVDERQRQYPEESRGDSALAVALEGTERRAARDRERARAAWAAEDAERAERIAAARQRDEPAAVAQVPVRPPGTPSIDEDATPRRSRPRAGIVAQYDAFGRRVQ